MNTNLILIADDDADTRDVLTVALEQAGYQTLGVNRGATAARLLTVAKPVGLITDVRMPDMNGMELCRLARRQPATADVAIVMISASYHDHDVDAGLRAGADRYLAKPLSPRQLVTELHNAISERYQFSAA
ncbi:response regulator [Actinoplanes sichuanensis]|uniref:PleD family two-component system response regulator n=1 Tax=Actinoplanes sichuanensis TaxID=512349 RepID=A0ABW4A336_9ACTN